MQNSKLSTLDLFWCRTGAVTLEVNRREVQASGSDRKIDTPRRTTLMYEGLRTFRVLMRLKRQIDQRCRDSQTADGRAERGGSG